MPNYCNSYWARLDSAGYVQPGTMQGFPMGQQPCGEICQWVQLQTTSYTTPVGKSVCKHPGGLRFFYQINRQGNIKPNSLIAALQYPQAKYNCGFWIEWIKYC